MAQQIKWGVLGAASIAIQRMMPAMREAPSATLHALASRDEGKARAVAAKFEAPRAYGDYDSLLADPEIDAVYVPLPNQLHFEWSIRALAAGKHVLCEKPLCLTSREVERLCIARDRAGKPLSACTAAELDLLEPEEELLVEEPDPLEDFAADQHQTAGDGVDFAWSHG